MSNWAKAESIVDEMFDNVSGFFEIHRGVMNFKYEFTSNRKHYIIRCYTKGREFLASTEFQYISTFKKQGAKVPNVVCFSEHPFPYLIYEKIEGECLGDIFDTLPFNVQENLCRQIYDNYNKISEVKTKGCGVVLSYGSFPNQSWQQFLFNEILKSFEYLSTVAKPFDLKKVRQYVLDIVELRIENKQQIVWSDFSPDNIIVDKNGNLAGFIDFEGLLGGDPLLGIGYLQARNAETNFYRLFYESSGLFKHREIIDFYSVIRYLRLIPYENTHLPNGNSRCSVKSFLPNSMNLINNICND